MSSASLAIDGAGQPQVKLLSKETVVPSSPSPPHPFFLACLDILWRDIHYNRRLLFYRSPRLPSLSFARNGSDGRTYALMQQLKRSLSLCLVHYFCWCGRLAKEVDLPHRLFIDCNDAGVEFVEASIDMPLSRLAQDGFQMKPFYDELCQEPDHRGEYLFSSPLLSIQATLFSDGGLAVGIAQSHVVADGLSLWHFMVSWGECSRGVPLSAPPLHDRQRLAVPNPDPEKAQWSFYPELSGQDKADLEVEIGSEVDTSRDNGREEATGSSTSVRKDRADFALPGDGDKHGKGGEEPADANDGPRDSGNPSADEVGQIHPKPPTNNLVQWMFTLSASAVKKLKTEAGEGYTSFELLCAHLWQRISIARKAPVGECTSLLVPVNSRACVMPPLPPLYFGNVITPCLIASVASRIRKEPLGAIANRIHSGLAAVKGVSIEPFMHWLETHDNRIVTAVKSPPSWPPGKGMNVSSSPWFPAYEVDFGWGKPVAIRAAKVPQEGGLVFFGGRPGSNLRDVEICTALPRDVLENLSQDPVFVGKSPYHFPLD